MSEITYSAWFDNLVEKTGDLVATRRVLQAIGCPASGNGLLVVADLVSKSLNAAVGNHDEFSPWVKHAQLVYTAIQSLVIQRTTLSKPTKKEHDLETYGRLCKLGEVGHLKLAPSVLESIGWMLIDAIRINEPLSAKTADQLLAFHRSAERTSPDSEWDALRIVVPLSAPGLDKVTQTIRGNRDAISLAKKLKQAAFTIVNAPDFPSDRDYSDSTGNNESQVNAEDVDRNTVKPTKKTPKEKRVPKAPSVTTLKASASYVSALDAFGIADAWNCLSPARLQKTVIAMAADLALMGSGDRPCIAAISIISLYINHSLASTLKLSLVRNEDIWIDKKDGHVYFNRKAFLGLKGAPDKNDIIRISLPSKINNFIKRRIQENPRETTLAGLLGMVNPIEWLEKIEKYLIAIGDQAHKSRSGRLVHSLGLTYLHLGASPELAAFDTLSPHLAGDSSLNYLRFETSYLNSIRNKVAKYLDLGEVELDSDSPEWVGSARCPTDEQFRMDWNCQSTTSSDAIKNVRKAKSAIDLVKEFNKGSAANSRALRAATGGRMQLTNRPSHRDLLTHESYIYTYDKKTQPSSARLTPRTNEIDAVICAQLKLAKAARSQLIVIGIPEMAIPKLLAEPSHHSAFFTELYLYKRDGSAEEKVYARPITLETVKTAIPPNSQIANNSSRHFWGSKCAASQMGLWLERTLLGHGRKLAVVGSWCTSVPPAVLIEQVRAFMRSTFDELKLENYAGIKNAHLEFLKPAIQFKSMDRRKPQTNGLNRDMPLNYCNDTSLPAVAAVDILRTTLLQADSADANEKSLLSILTSDGITNPKDVRCIWKHLTDTTDLVNQNFHKWTRESGQEIEVPMQPSTRIHLGRIDKILPLDTVLLELRNTLQEVLPNITWPSTAEGVLNALCWLSCRWVRLRIAPILIYCADPATTAATYNSKSINRLFRPVKDSSFRFDELQKITHRRKHSYDRATDLARLVRLVGKYADGNVDDGEDLRRSKQLKEALLDNFDGHDCHPLATLLIMWLHLETSIRIDGNPDPISVSVMYEYLTRIQHRIQSFSGNNTDLSEWSNQDWKRFTAWILDVNDYIEDKQSNVLNNRKIALRRVLGTLLNSGTYHVPHDVLPGLPPKSNRAWCESASRIFVGAKDIADVKLCIEYLYQEWEIKRAQMHAMLGLTLSACMRSDEGNAIRLSHVGSAIAILTSSGFSQIKTEGSRRIGNPSEELNDQINNLMKLLKKLPDQPSMLFSEDHSRIHLSIGRAMQSVLVDLFRSISGDSAFVYHSLRGAALQMQATPNYENHLRYTFNGGYFALDHSIALTKSLAGADPRHLAECFVHSGHASHRTPSESYLSYWPLLYACAMRATHSGDRLDATLSNLIPLKNDQQLRTERSRYGNPDIDEWTWAILPIRSKRNEFKKSDDENVRLGNLNPCEVSVDPLCRMKYGVFKLLQVDKAVAEHETKIGRTQANQIDEILRFAPQFNSLHKRTPGRKDKEGRPLRTSIRDVSLPLMDEILEFIHSCPSPALLALETLLSNQCRSVTVSDVNLALSAIPMSLKLELCWPQGELDRNLSLQLNGISRLTGLDTRRHIHAGIRVRVIPPGTNRSEVLATHLTTLTRTAALIRRLLLNADRK